MALFIGSMCCFEGWQGEKEFNFHIGTTLGASYGSAAAALETRAGLI